jgi:hypothetical protein
MSKLQEVLQKGRLISQSRWGTFCAGGHRTVGELVGAINVCAQYGWKKNIRRDR